MSPGDRDEGLRGGRRVTEVLEPLRFNAGCPPIELLRDLTVYAAACYYWERAEAPAELEGQKN